MGHNSRIGSTNNPSTQSKCHRVDMFDEESLVEILLHPKFWYGFCYCVMVKVFVRGNYSTVHVQKTSLRGERCRGLALLSPAPSQWWTRRRPGHRIKGQSREASHGSCCMPLVYREKLPRGTDEQKHVFLQFHSSVVKIERSYNYLVNCIINHCWGILQRKHNLEIYRLFLRRTEGNFSPCKF
jgi:hypothetical protein